MNFLERLRAWRTRRKERGPYSVIYGCYTNSPEYQERRIEKLYEMIEILNREDAERERKKAEREEKAKRKMEKRERKKMKAHRE